MNPLVKFLQKKLPDTTIRTVRIVFGIIYILALYYNFFISSTPNTIQDNIFWQTISSQTQTIVIWIMIGFGFIPLILGITNLCLFKSKYMRIMQIIYGIILFYFSHIIIASPNLDIDALLFFMAFLPIIGGITGKMITKKCSNYGYKVTKIRV